MQLYRVIIADPPWPYDNPRALVGTGGRGTFDGCEKLKQVDVDGQYSTMNLTDIIAIRPPADKNSLLFLWCTNPTLCDGRAARVVRAWGFEPKSVITWAKVQADGVTPSRRTGHWFRSATEHVIF